MTPVSDSDETTDSLSISAALCVDAHGYDRLTVVLRYLAVGLVDQAVRVRLVSPDPRIESLVLGPIQSLVHLPISWLSAGKRIGQVIEALTHQPPTVVHALTCGSYRVAAAVAAAFDADLVLQVTSLADCDTLAPFISRRVGRYIALTRPLAAVLEEQLQIPEDSIAVVHPGILTSQQIACFAQPERKPAILCSAPLEKDSGVDRLIEATAMLQKRNHALLVFLLGRGSWESALRRYVRQRNLSSCISFAQPLGDSSPAMHSADIFVVPVSGTTFDVSVLRAMGAGMAVVSFRNPISDYLCSQETALVCGESSAESVANAIEQLLTDRALARRIATAGMEYVRAHHGVSGMGEGVADVYRKLALARATFSITE